jgi:signal transduction protein with GAF and PtsI domain
MSDEPGVGRAAAALLAAVARRIEAADRVAPSTDDALLTAIARTAAVVLHAEAASIAIHDPATDRLVFHAAAGPHGTGVIGLAIEATAGIAGYAFTTGQPLAIADVAADPRFDRTVAEATGYVPRTLLAAPLTDAQGTLGVLEVLDRRDGTFTMHDLDVAGALAGEAAVIVRGGTKARDAAALLYGALASLARSTDPAALDEAAIDALVERATADLAVDDDDPTWRLADRLARLRDVDPDALELAIEWLDALLRRRGRGSFRGSSGGRG